MYFLFLLFGSNLTFAQETCELKGKVVDEKGNAIPYSSIYFSAISKGGMANSEGTFSIKVPCGNYEVIFQSLGYQTKKMQVELKSQSKEIEVSLSPTTYQLKEVVVDPSSEDPAYNIIRKATVMAQYYRKQITAFNTNLYIRRFYNVDDIPWIAEKLAPEEDLEDMKTGNISETLLEYSFKKPNTIKEKIIARKTGDKDTSKTGSNFINMSFYNLGGTGIINPLQRGAFQVYKFEHQSTYFDGDQKVHKIEIIPKRKGNDLMRGYLYINDGIWNINAVNVEFDQTGGRIFYTQFYKALSPTVWMPINHKIKVDFAMVGFKGEVQYLATLSEVEVITDSLIDNKIKENLNLHEAEPSKEESLKIESIVDDKNLSKTQQKINELIQKEKLNNKETIKLVRLIKKEADLEKEKQNDTTKSYELKTNHKIIYADSALSENDSLWKSERDVPLSKKETAIYVARDSLTKVKKGDTIIPVKRSIVGNLLFYNEGIQSKNKNRVFTPKGLLSGFSAGFNTVDGFFIHKTLLEYKWDNRKGKYYSIKPELGYAIAREQLLGKINFDSQYNLKKNAGFKFSAGRQTTDFNNYKAMHHWQNTFSTLFFTTNYGKFFQEDFFTLEHHFDPINGLQLSTSIHYADRSTLSNNSSFKLFNFSNIEYTENIPENDELIGDPSLIEDQKSARFELNAKYTPRQYYYIRNNKKHYARSRYPTFNLNYLQGIPDFVNSQADFSFLSLSVNQEFSFRLINKISYHLEVGKFLNNDQVFFADFKNYSTSPFYLQLNTNSDAFSLLDYYRFNTNDQYLQAHFSVEDNHILLKYLPLFNQTNFTETIHFNYLINDRITNYYEVGYSLNRIFLLVNVGVYTAFIGKDFDQINFRISLNLGDLGN